MHTKKRQLNLLIQTLALSGKGKKKKKTCPWKVSPETRIQADFGSEFTHTHTHILPQGDLKRSMGQLSLK